MAEGRDVSSYRCYRILTSTANASPASPPKSANYRYKVALLNVLYVPAHLVGGYTPSLYSILVQRQNQTRDDLEANVTQSRRSLA
jgi:hypothetical protein